MRRPYNFSSSISQDSYFYCRKITGGKIENKEGLRNALNAIVIRFELIDTTIKIYDSILFFFFMMEPMVKLTDLIDIVNNKTFLFGEWNEKYLCSGFYDLQERYLRKDLQKWGFVFDEE